MSNIGDVMVGRDYLEVKTTMGVSSFKVSWAADDDSADRFRRQWKPQADLILVQVRWGTLLRKLLAYSAGGVWRGGSA